MIYAGADCIPYKIKHCKIARIKNFIFYPSTNKFVLDGHLKFNHDLFKYCLKIGLVLWK